MKTLFLKGMLVLTLLVGMTMTRAYGYHVFVGEECIAAVINGKTDALIEKFDFFCSNIRHLEILRLLIFSRQL